MYSKYTPEERQVATALDLAYENFKKLGSVASINVESFHKSVQRCHLLLMSEVFEREFPNNVDAVIKAAEEVAKNDKSIKSAE